MAAEPDTQGNNPYQSPECFSEPGRVAFQATVVPRPLLVINTYVALGLCAAWVALAISVIYLPPSKSSGFAHMSAVGSLPIVVGFAIVVFQSVFLRSRLATSIATILYWMGAAFTLLALVKNVGEALMKWNTGTPSFLAIFIPIALILFAYLVMCAKLSSSWSWALSSMRRH